jgi:hypothetical protein
MLLGVTLLRKPVALAAIGGIPQPAIMVFLAYVAGLVLYTITGTGVGLLAYWFGLRFGARVKPLPEGLEPWKDQQWRQVARQFIGDALSPIVEAPVPPDLLKLQVDNVKLMVLDPGEQGQKVSGLMTTQLDRQRADFQWFGWYQALAVWFPQPSGFTEYPFATVVYAIIVAVVALLVIARSSDWRLWLGCVVVFLISALYEVVAAMNYISDTTGRYHQMAGMLRDLRSRSTTTGPQQTGTPAVES